MCTIPSPVVIVVAACLAMTSVSLFAVGAYHLAGLLVTVMVTVSLFLRKQVAEGARR